MLDVLISQLHPVLMHQVVSLLRRLNPDGTSDVLEGDTVGAEDLGSAAESQGHVGVTLQVTPTVETPQIAP